MAHRRVPASALSGLAKFLGVSLEELVGEAPQPGKRGPAPKIQQQMERVSQLPKPKQRMVLEVLEAVLAQQSR
jgi:hypothetical protein